MPFFTLWFFPPKNCNTLHPDLRHAVGPPSLRVHEDARLAYEVVGFSINQLDRRHFSPGEAPFTNRSRENTLTAILSAQFTSADKKRNLH
jgi:hypothetical protein